LPIHGIKQAKELAKLAPAEILSIVGRQIIDSRGNPTVEAGEYYSAKCYMSPEKIAPKRN
jgi:hypothetical protein